MSENRRNTGEPEFVDGIPVRTEEIGFLPDQMWACPTCSKANPPTRKGCLYCGTSITGSPFTADSDSLELRQLEEWEIGGNLIISGEGATDSAIANVAGILPIETQIMAEFARHGAPLPIARLELGVAERVAAEFAKEGIACRVVSDEQLRSNEPPIRVRELHFDAANFETVNFNTRERLRFLLADVEVVIAGRIFNKSKATTEKKQRKERKVIDETEVSSDETVLDIYVKGHELGFRVQVNGFDFSCLGPDKRLLAVENMAVLRTNLSAAAINAAIIDDFDRLGELLSIAWPLEVRTDSLGIHRSGLGRKDLKRVATVSNLRQFNRYSRLRRMLL
ncbi:hypothetical protein BH24ACI3_BH24ACI3_16370 [soil metagenome]